MPRNRVNARSKAARKGQTQPRKKVKKPEPLHRFRSDEDDVLPLTPTQQKTWDYKQKAIQAGKDFLKKMSPEQKRQMYSDNGYWIEGEEENSFWKIDGKQFEQIKRDKVRRDLDKNEKRDCLKCGAKLKDAEAEYNHIFGHDQDAKCVCPEAGCGKEFGRPDSLMQHGRDVHMCDFKDMRENDSAKYGKYKRVWTLGKTVYSDIVRVSHNFPAGYLMVKPVGERENIFDVRSQSEMIGGIVVWKAKKNRRHIVTFAPKMGVEELSSTCFDYRIYFAKINQRYRCESLTTLQIPDWIEQEEFGDYEVESIESHFPATTDEPRYTESYGVKYVGFEGVYTVAKEDAEGCRDMTAQYWREIFTGERETETEKSVKKVVKKKVIGTVQKRSERLAAKNP